MIILIYFEDIYLKKKLHLFTFSKRINANVK